MAQKNNNYGAALIAVGILAFLYWRLHKKGSVIIAPLDPGSYGPAVSDRATSYSTIPIIAEGGNPESGGAVPVPVPISNNQNNDIRPEFLGPFKYQYSNGKVGSLPLIG